MGRGKKLNRPKILYPAKKENKIYLQIKTKDIYKSYSLTKRITKGLRKVNPEE